MIPSSENPVPPAEQGKKPEASKEADLTDESLDQDPEVIGSQAKAEAAEIRGSLERSIEQQEGGLVSKGATAEEQEEYQTEAAELRAQADEAQDELEGGLSGALPADRSGNAGNVVEASARSEEEERNGEPTEEEWRSEVQAMIDSLPEGLPKKEEFQALLDESLDADAIKKIKLQVGGFIGARDKALKRSLNGSKKEKYYLYSELTPGDQIQAKKRINRAREEALSLKGHESVGKGMTAEVFVGQKYREFCYKIITNRDEYQKGNTIETEAEIHDRLVGLQFEGARVPRPVYFEMDGETQLMVMERVPGKTLDEVTQAPSVLPADFDVDQFGRALLGFIEQMHSRGIYHRDLHSGNVMIDLKTGEPRLIDFGKATTGALNEEDAYFDREKGIRYIDDVNSAKAMVAKLKEKLRLYGSNGEKREKGRQ